jgi:hypothetical protein
VRTIVFATLLAASAVAQSDSTQYTTDINGHQVADLLQDTTKDSKQELSRSINGGTVPLESSEMHVIDASPNHNVVEVITKRYTQTGKLSMTERRLVEKQVRPGGSSTETTKVFVSDVNGTLKETERRSVETQVQGSTTTSQIVVDRPNFNGSFSTAEKRSIETQKSGDRTDTNETVYQMSQNGSLFPVLQQVKTETKSGSATTQQTVSYQPGITGKMEMFRQAVSTTTKDANGNEITEVDLYARAADGRVYQHDAPPQIQERQLVTRTKSGNSVTEALSVRRPSLSDPNKLGDVRKISEVVCTGKCGN